MPEPEIPEYYRHLANQPAEKESPASAPARGAPRKEAAPSSYGGRSTPDRMTGKRAELPDTSWSYNAHAFAIALPEGWQDKTVFTLTGPVTDGIQHNITITRQADLPVDNLLDFAELQIQSLEDTLKGCRLLLKESIVMDDAREAYRAIFVWWPVEDLRIYQEQVYVLHAKTGFTLTASFTKKTRKTIGPEIERAMLSFSPTE